MRSLKLMHNTNDRTLNYTTGPAERRDRNKNTKFTDFN